MRDRVVGFIDALRQTGLRPSVSESLDAMQAVAAAGIERAHLREALATTLVKDEALRCSFDTVFDRYFAVGGTTTGNSARTAHAGEGQGHGSGDGLSLVPPRRAKESERSRRGLPRQIRSPASHEATDPRNHLARQRELLQRDLKDMQPDEIEACDRLAEELARRFHAHLARRQRRHHRGQLDLRRIMRRSSSKGGVPIELLFRRRRPGRCDLFVLCDHSYSVTAASRFLLSLLLPCRAFFRHVHLFAFVDRPVPISFEDGHLVPHEHLDLHARSDLGATLVEVGERFASLVTRNTIVLILGDARNNRRPPRADCLARLAATARHVVWLNPEPERLWRTGDSCIASYAPHCATLLAASTPTQLAHALTSALAR